MKNLARDGVSFQGKTVLITGCGKDSIGLEMVKGLLRGGAKVYATTSKFSSAGSRLYLSVFNNHGSKFSELIVLPFNQASAQVCNISLLLFLMLFRISTLLLITFTTKREQMWTTSFHSPQFLKTETILAPLILDQ